MVKYGNFAITFPTHQTGTSHYRKCQDPMSRQDPMFRQFKFKLKSQSHWCLQTMAEERGPIYTVVEGEVICQ